MKRRDLIATGAAAVPTPLAPQMARSQDIATAATPFSDPTEGASAVTSFSADGLEALQAAMDAIVASGKVTQSSAYYVASTPFVDFWSAANAAVAT
jgi:hypothetical protein